MDDPYSIRSNMDDPYSVRSNMDDPYSVRSNMDNFLKEHFWSVIRSYSKSNLPNHPNCASNPNNQQNEIHQAKYGNT